MPPACGLTQVLGPSELTTYEVHGAYSTQKTSLIGWTVLYLIYCAPQLSISDVGLTPNSQHARLHHLSGLEGGHDDVEEAVR